ncbi:transglutaminase domain-containing protein [Candidatus Microgenomates bacterium]|nr:transglutaminase domain-containing protein [Candidatus Microgenomates bacterium]MBI2622122.1 transglutaminase domain-containing protein [Candidatus Microgenomates bacterium]
MKKILLLVIYFLLFTTPVQAEEEKFETKQTVNYTVYENGITQVIENITLKNKTDEFRPSEYSIEISLKDTTNVRVSDQDGPVTPKVEKQDGKTSITFQFNSRVIGKDKELSFVVSYETKELAVQKGTIWEVSIPGIADKTNFKEYLVNLTVPEKLGTAAYIKPNKNLDNRKLTWSKEEIPKGGMIISFGEFQTFRFDLSYQLKNPRLYPIKTEIALPPNTNYQNILINDLSPKPMNVVIDKDGNWLAQYQIPPLSELPIKAVGIAQLFLNPQKSEDLSPDEIISYTAPQKFWEVADSSINDLAKVLKTPANIYNHVVSELAYDYSKLEKGGGRVGAANVLKNKNSAICMEFTDLFIALARAANIPAREVNGFAYTQDVNLRPLSLVNRDKGDILHAWPEYYNSEKNSWIMVDPTWGNTTGGLDYFNILDFDHLTLVVKGKDSQYPIPAGGYKTEKTKEARDVNVTLGQAGDLTVKEQQEFEILLPQKIPPFIPIQGQVKVLNRGNTLLPARTMTISKLGERMTSQLIGVPQIPPYGQQLIPFSFPAGSIFSQEKVIIRAEDQFNKTESAINISLLTLVDDWRLLVAGGVIIGGSLFYLTFKTWRLHLARQKQEDTLRGKGP